MGTDQERDIARGIERHKRAEATASMSAGLGCAGVVVLGAIILALFNVVNFWLILGCILIGFIVGAVIYRRSFDDVLNR